MGTSAWLTVKLAELCDSIDYGYTASASSNPVGPKFLRITDIVDGYIDWNTVPFCDIEPALEEKYRLHHGDIVIARTGAQTGVSTYISKPPRAIFASYLVRLKMGSRSDSRFVSYLLKSPSFWGYIRGVLGDKSAQPNASARTMTQVSMLLPPLLEQRAIAHILGTLDDKIELNRRMNQTLEAMAQALFKNWFVDFEPFRGQGMQDSPLGEIPLGWGVGRVDDIAVLHRESVNPSNYPDEVFEHYSIPAFDEGRIPKIEIGEEIKSNKFRIPNEAVLISKLNPRFPRIWLSFDSNSQRSVCSTEFLVVTPVENSTREYIYSLFCSKSFLETFTMLVTGTSSSHQRVRPEDLMATNITLPPDRVTINFSDTMRPLLTLVNRNIVQNSTLSDIRDSLLPKLLSGEIRVKDAEKFAENRI